MFSTTITIEATSAEQLDRAVRAASVYARHAGATATGDHPAASIAQAVPFPPAPVPPFPMDRGEAKRAAADELRGQLRRGDLVELTGQLRPKYLIGQRATVERVNDASVTVTMGPNAGRFAGQSGVRVPAPCCKPVTSL